MSNVPFVSGSTSAALQTESNKSQISNLVFSPDGDSSGGSTTGASASGRGRKPQLFKKDGSGNSVQMVVPIDGNAAADQQLTLGGYTHKVPVMVNGEQFFMLGQRNYLGTTSLVFASILNVLSLPPGAVYDISAKASG